jgi:outer membrane biogenesis lipoprotein LolB
MKKLVCLVCAAAFLTACGTSPEERRDKAEAQYYEEKTNMMQEYQACIKKAKDDQQQLDACERLKPVE